MWREEGKARDQGREVLGNVLFLTSILPPFSSVLRSPEGVVKGGRQPKTGDILFLFEFPLFASAVSICNVVQHEQGPGGGAVSSVRVKTGQGTDQQRAKGGGEILVRVQGKTWFFAARKCVIKVRHRSRRL